MTGKDDPRRPSIPSGVPDGLTETADWSSMGDEQPDRADVRPAAVDWARMPTQPIPAGGPPGGQKTTDWSRVPVDPIDAGVPAGGQETTDWSAMPVEPIDAGAPAGSQGTTDWSALPVEPIDAGAPAGSQNTTDWSSMPVEPIATGAPEGGQSTTDWSSMPVEPSHLHLNSDLTSSGPTRERSPRYRNLLSIQEKPTLLPSIWRSSSTIVRSNRHFRSRFMR